MPLHQSSFGRGALSQVGQRAPGLLLGLFGGGGGGRRPKGRKPRSPKAGASFAGRRGEFDPRMRGTPESFARTTLPLAPPVRRPPPRSLTARPSATSAAEKNFGASVKFPPSEFGFGSFGGDVADCPPGTVPDPQGFCISPISPLGASRLVGEAIMGQYGAALVPGSRLIDRAVCLRGMQLGNDGLCYNKGQITNKQRMWPAGRKPLLTGGEMNAIRIASRAEGRVKRTAQRLGLLKAAPRRKRLPAGRGKTVLIESGPGSVVA